MICFSKLKIKLYNITTKQLKELPMISNICSNLSDRIANTRHQRKCSFCKNTGHTITNCDDLRLSGFKTYLFYIKNSILLNNDGELSNNLPADDNIYNSILKIEQMETFLYNYCRESGDNVKLTRTFASRYCSCRFRSRLQVTINKIIVYLFELNYALISNHTFNYTPFSEETPVRISCVLNGILMNYLIYNDLSYDNSNYETELEYSIFVSKINIKFNKYEIDNIDDIDDADEEKDKCQPDETIECSICYNDHKSINCLTFNCNHKFCGECTNQLFKSKHSKCPNCRSEINEITCFNEEIHEKLKQTYKKYNRIQNLM